MSAAGGMRMGKYPWSGIRTLDHCALITKMGCKPRQYDGKCEGFQKSYNDDEPCEICKECKLNVFYEPDEPGESEDNMKYRKKPVTVEAFTIESGECPWWFINALEKKTAAVHRENNRTYATICTLEGEMRAEEDDYIIRGVQGEIYPCKPDIFEATYEKVEDDHGPE